MTAQTPDCAAEAEQLARRLGEVTMIVHGYQLQLALSRGAGTPLSDKEAEVKRELSAIERLWQELAFQHLQANIVVAESTGEGETFLEGTVEGKLNFVAISHAIDEVAERWLAPAEDR